MIDRVIEIAEEAGRVIQAVREKGFEVEQKGTQGPVTEADRAADELLRTRLLALEGCGWLSEETADDKWRLQEERLWVVDPLDGTKEFVKGIPEYSVAIGLVENGTAILGVGHNPSTGNTYSASRGAGAFKNGDPIEVAEGRRLLASRSEIERGSLRRSHPTGSWSRPGASSTSWLSLVPVKAVSRFPGGPSGNGTSVQER